MHAQNKRDISRTVKLLLSANRKTYMPRRLVQQRMTLSDLECLKSTLSASRAISAVAEHLVLERLNTETFK